MNFFGRFCDSEQLHFSILAMYTQIVIFKDNEFSARIDERAHYVGSQMFSVCFYDAHA